MSEDRAAQHRESLEQDQDQAHQMALAIAKSQASAPPPEPEPPPAPPVNVDVPLVTPETANVGDTLTCTMGNWEGEPSHYDYKWARAGAEEEEVIPNSPTYTVKGGDAGSSISCVVTATNGVGSTAAPPSNAISIPATRGTKK